MEILKHRIVTAFAAFFLVLVMVFLLKDILPGREEEFSEAQKAYNNWNIFAAEKLLDKLYRSDPSDIKIASLYANTLFRRRKLYRAKEVLAGIKPPDAPSAIDKQLKLAQINYFLSRLDSAQLNLKKAEQMAGETGDSSAIAVSFNIKGLIEFNRLNYKKALRYQERSLGIAERNHYPGTTADALRQLGVLYWYSGKYDSALNDFYKPALIIYRRIRDKIGEATTLSDIGLIYRYRKKLEENISYQFKAFVIRKKIGDKAGLADSYYFLSNSIAISGWEGSIIYAYLKKSYKISKEIGYKWGMEVASRALKVYYYRQQEFSSRVYSLKDTSDIIGEGTIYRLWNKAKVQRSKGNLTGQVETLENLVNLDDSLGYSNGELFSLVHLASGLTYLGKFQKAKIILQKASELEIANHYSDFLFDTTLARYLIKSGDLKEAKKILLDLTQKKDSACLNYISPNNDRITGNNLYRIQKERSAAYSMLVDVLYSINNDNIFKAIQRERIFTFWFRSNTLFNYTDKEMQTPFEQFVRLLDQFEHHPEKYNDIQKLTDQFEIAQANVTKVNKVISDINFKKRKLPQISAEKIQEKLNNNEVVLEYFIGIDNVYSIVVKKDRVKVLKLNTTRSELNSMVSLYNDLVKRGAKNPRDKLWRGVAGRLYNILIKPVEELKLLKKNEHIIISAHKILHTLPFGTLLGPGGNSDKEFLVEKYIISYIPSPAFWIDSRRRNKRTNYNSLLAIAPYTGSLTGTVDEIRSIPRQNFMKFNTLTNKSVLKDRILRSFGQYDIVHIASHAVINPWFPLYSYIECADKNLKLYEILDKDITANLIVLSACETGRGISAAGGIPQNEDFLSLSRAFLLKGAGTVISSFWVVNDKTSAELMKYFYQEMFPVPQQSLNYNSIEFSLNYAKRRFIEKHKKNSQFYHPFYWGGYFVSGNSEK